MSALILNREEVLRFTSHHKDLHYKVALVTGCFDVFHFGHLQLLQHASAFYKHAVIMVGLNSDAAIRKLKGDTRPIHSFHIRSEMIRELNMVDAVFEIDDTEVTNTIHALSPDAWVKGGDYTMQTLNPKEVEAAKAVGAQIVLFKSSYSSSTSGIIKRLIEQ